MATATITTAMCVGGRELSEPRLSPDGTLVLHGVRSGGRSALAVVPLAGGPERLLACDPPPAAGRGLGGGCTSWCPDGRGIVYVATDGQVWLHALDGAMRRLSALAAGSEASCPAVSPDGTRVAYVVDLAEVRVHDLRTGVERRVDRGRHEFVLDPAWHPRTGRLVWMAWSAPHMPWDESAVVAARGVVAGAPGVQVQQPRFDAHGRLWSVRDGDGWLNVHRGDERVVAERFEHAGPTWGPGQRSYAVSPDGRAVAFARNEAGFGRLCVVSPGEARPREVARGVHGQLSWHGNTLLALRTGARTPTQIVAYDTTSWERRVLAVGPAAEWDAVDLPEPEVLLVPGRVPGRVPLRVYRPGHGRPRGLICWVHGGPTDQWQVTFLPRLAYWVSRGWTVAVPDHRGSTGHGRAFQQALHRRWGVADVADVAAAIAAAHQRGLGTPANTVLMGGSAGGFTALHVAIHHSHLVAAAAVAYPVTDLSVLDEHTHRFEAHYTATLVDPRRYRARSPITHAEALRRPVLILHGSVDPVVPVDSSVDFAQRARAAGAQVELHVYDGEGHGFRQPQNQADEFARIEAFLQRHVGARTPRGHGR